MKRPVVPAIRRALYFVLCAVVLAGCAGDQGRVPGQEKLHVGDSKDKLIRMMGPPDYRRGGGDGEVLQYCTTGFANDAYRVYWVRGDKILAMTSYPGVMQIGFCASHFRPLTWNDAPPHVRPPAQEKKDKPKGGGVASGTGFFINGQGAIVTNAHVVEGCKSIMVRGAGPAVVQVADFANDLAVLRVSGATAHPYARMDQSKVARLGEEVVVFGYPLSGALASSGNLTTGNISALAGFGNNIGRYQISAPVQPGNSGGPLLDRSGNVLGVIVSKLNAVSVAAAIGDLPQNVNFAVKGAFVKTFLDVNNVTYEEAAAGAAQPIADVAAKAQRFTVFIQCELDD